MAETAVYSGNIDVPEEAINIIDDNVLKSQFEPFKSLSYNFGIFADSAIRNRRGSQG